MTEFRIHRVLRRLARQRVAMILQPGNVWVIEYALDHETKAALCTCHMRGWVDIMHNAVPSANLTPDGHHLQDNLDSKLAEPMYRLTETGWSVINRTQLWLFATFIVAFATLVATIGGVMVTRVMQKMDTNQVLYVTDDNHADVSSREDTRSAVTK
jgi:hypothetical protein